MIFWEELIDIDDHDSHQVNTTCFINTTINDFIGLVWSMVCGGQFQIGLGQRFLWLQSVQDQS